MNGWDTRVYACWLLAAAFIGCSAPSLAASKPTYANKMDLGQQLFFNGDIDRAIRAFQAAAELNPKSADPHNMLLNLYLQKGGPGAAENAIREAHEVLERKPNMKDIHFALGNLLRNQASAETDPAKQKAEIAEAVQELQTAENTGSKRALCEYTIGMLNLQQGDTDQARAHLEAALNDQQDLPDAHMVHAVLMFKQASKPAADGKAKDLASPELKHQIKDVLDELDLAIKQKGKYAEAYNTKAEIQLATGDLDGARQSYAHAVQDEPKYTAAWVGLGTCEAQLATKETDSSKQAEHLGKAVEAFQSAKKLNPNDKNTVYALAVMLEKLGRIQEAVAEYENTLLMETDAVARANIQGHLLQLEQQAGMQVTTGLGGLGIGGGGIGGIGTAGSTMFTGGTLGLPMKDLIKPPDSTDKK